MSTPLISVIIATHNRPDFLERALASIEKQSYSNWEVVIVDDGSPIAVYDELISKNRPPKYVWRRQPQSGPGVARETGIKFASGDYFTFLDDDDYYLPSHFEFLIKAMEGSDHQIYRSNLIGISPDGKTTRFSGYKNDMPTLPQYWKTPSNLTALLFSRSVIEKVPIDTVRTTIEDFTWLIRVFSHYDLHQVSNYSAVYVLHDANRNNNSYGKQYLWDRLNAMEGAYAYGTVDDQIPPILKDNWIIHQHFHFARNSIRSGKWNQAFWAIKNCPKRLNGFSIKECLYTLYFTAKTLAISPFNASIAKIL